MHFFLRHLHVARLKSKSQRKVASCEENNYVWSSRVYFVECLKTTKNSILSVLSTFKLWLI